MTATPDAYGFFTATEATSCGICTSDGEHWTVSRIDPGHIVRRMPEQWEPKQRHRLAHQGCVLILAERIEVKTGQRITLEQVAR